MQLRWADMPRYVTILYYGISFQQTNEPQQNLKYFVKIEWRYNTAHRFGFTGGEGDVTPPLVTLITAQIVPSADSKQTLGTRGLRASCVLS